MGLFKNVTFLLVLSLPLQASSQQAQMLFMARHGATPEAIRSYRDYAETSGHDFSLLRQIAQRTLEATPRKPESLFLGLHGTAIAMDETLLPFVAQCLTYPDETVQLAATALCRSFDSIPADELALKALASPYLSPRLEALHLLSTKQHPQALDHIESLMNQIVPELVPILAPLLTLIELPEADGVLKRLLHHPNPHVRRMVILSLADNTRDDFLDILHDLAKQGDPFQQEACAFTLGALYDSTAESELKQLAQSSIPSIQVAALSSLYQLGHLEAVQSLESLAQQGNVFAITALGDPQIKTRALPPLLDHPDLNVQINATYSLLKKRDLKALRRLEEIVLRDSRDLALVPTLSPGGALSTIKAIHSCQEKLKKQPELSELSTQVREAILIEAAHLPEPYFLELAEKIFASGQKELVPTLIHLLENLHTQEAIALLQKEQNRVGAPFIRTYATLALYRLGEEPEGEEALKAWLETNCHHPLVEIRPLLPWSKPKKNTHEAFTPAETAQLLIESFLALAQKQNIAAIELLLDMLEKGDPSNRPALAGLLMRTLE